MLRHYLKRYSTSKLGNLPFLLMQTVSNIALQTRIQASGTIPIKPCLLNMLTGDPTRIYLTLGSGL